MKSTQTSVNHEYKAPIHHRWAAALLIEKKMRPSRGLLLILAPIFPGFVMALTGILGAPVGIWLTGLVMIFSPILIVAILEQFADQYEANQYLARDMGTSPHKEDEDDSGP